MTIRIRPAEADDDVPLAALDRATWSSTATPTAPPAPDQPFFDEQCRPEDVLVATVDGEVVGYLRTMLGLPAGVCDHVRHINGFAVAPHRQRQGVGRALLEAAIFMARTHHGRRLTLRVLGHNHRARQLYDSLGFVVEGVLVGEFLLDGAYVDDVLMAFDLAPAVS